MISRTRSREWCSRLLPVVITLGVACRSSVERDVRLLEIRPISDTQAMLVWDNGGNDGYSVARWEPSRVVWSHQLAAPPQLTFAGGLLQSGAQTFVREVNTTGRRHTILIEGFDKSGKRQWVQGIASVESDHDPQHVGANLFLNAFVDDTTGRLYQVVTNDKPELLEMDVQGGTIVHRCVLPDAPMTPLLRDGSLLVHEGGRPFDVRSCAPLAQPGGLGCAHRLESNFMHEVAEIMASSPPGSPVSAPGLARVDACASYHGRMVAVVRNEETTAVVIADADSRAARVILPAPVLMSVDMVGVDPAASALTGDLPRYVPYLVYRDGAETLVVVDLEQRRVAWTMPVDNLGARIFLHGTRWYVAMHDFGGVNLAVIDGERGSVLGEARVVSPGGVMLPGPEHLRDDVLWVGASGWSGADALRVARLDATTLVPLTVSGDLSVVPGRAVVKPVQK